MPVTFVVAVAPVVSSPDPVTTPPLQLNVLFSVSPGVSFSVPALTVRLGVFATTFKASVPPLTVIELWLIAPLVGVIVSAPPGTLNALLNPYVPFTFTAPPLTLRSPAPFTLLNVVSVCVPPPNPSTVPLATLNAPSCVPPFARFSVPLLMFTVLPLLTVTSMD